MKSRRSDGATTHVELLFLALPGHVCLVGLGVANLIKVIRDDGDDIPLTLEFLRSHAPVSVEVLISKIWKGKDLRLPFLQERKWRQRLSRSQVDT